MATTTMPILQPRGPVTRHDSNPWVMWQSIPPIGSFTCVQCQIEQTGERFLELTGNQSSAMLVLPKNPSHLTTMASRVGRRVLCASCRWHTPETTPAPRPRKTQLD